MKKFIGRKIFFLFIFLFVINIANAKQVESELVSVVNLYKDGNYISCYQKVDDYIKKDPSNALAHYYKAISSVKLGKEQEARASYNAVLELSKNMLLMKYATKGLACLDGLEACNEVIVNSSDKLDDAVNKLFTGSNSFSEEALREHQKFRLDYMQEEINNNPNIEIKKYKDFKDFSTELPTDDEIKKAIHVFEKLGYSMNDILRIQNSNLTLNSLKNDEQFNIENLQMLLHSNIPMDF